MPCQEKPQSGYVGVNLRADRSNVADDKQATRAINVDFNKELGTASIRNGRYELADLNDDVVRLIAKVNAFRFYMAGRHLYRDGVLVDISPEEFSSGLITDIEGMRPLNDLAIWAFIADIGNREQINTGSITFTLDEDSGAFIRISTTDGRGHSAMKKDDGTRTFKWGIGEPPTTINSIELNDSAGYTWYITYLRYDTTNTDNPLALAHEGNPIIIYGSDGAPPA